MCTFTVSVTSKWSLPALALFKQSSLQVLFQPALTTSIPSFSRQLTNHIPGAMMLQHIIGSPCCQCAATAASTSSARPSRHGSAGARPATSHRSPHSLRRRPATPPPNPAAACCALPAPADSGFRIHRGWATAWWQRTAPQRLRTAACSGLAVAAGIGWDFACSGNHICQVQQLQQHRHQCDVLWLRALPTLRSTVVAAACAADQALGTL